MLGRPRFTMFLRTLGGLVLTGTITTDGTIGILSASDIESYNLSLVDLNNAPAPMNPTNTSLDLRGNDLIATLTTLSFNFADTSGDNLLDIFPACGFPCGTAVWLSAGANGGSAGSFGLEEAFSQDSFYFGNSSETNRRGVRHRAVGDAATIHFATLRHRPRRNVSLRLAQETEDCPCCCSRLIQTPDSDFRQTAARRSFCYRRADCHRLRRCGGRGTSCLAEWRVTLARPFIGST